ncbi:MAG: hypothetical protein LBS96_09850 [Oscillospiraceae bacterium]|jgi:hypothetical protein|nr:hypothetical protein [Oscillospiraceae bacterium]
MSPIRQEVQGYIDLLPDMQLEALKPILTLLANEIPVVETDLTAEEKAAVRQGRAEYVKGGYVPLHGV